jgi:uncharacterized protein (TIGR03083 family)
MDPAAQHSSHTEALANEVDRMHADLAQVDWAAPVATCGDWDVAALVEHLGTIHRWAAQLVRERSPQRLDRTNMDFGLPSTTDGYADWFAAGGAQLVDALRDAEGDESMWAWGVDQHVRFWSRRQVHETAVHHADLRLALGLDPPLTVDAATAADGIDELLDNLPAAAYFVPGVAELRGNGETVHLHATDGGYECTITLGVDGFSYEHSHGKGTVAVRGAVADLLLLLMNRRSLEADSARFEVFGDRAPLQLWLAHATL